ASSRCRWPVPFAAALRSDLGHAGAFTVADPVHSPPPPPTGYKEPTTPDVADRWLGTGAEALVDTRGEVSGDRVSVEARVWDLKFRKLILRRKYSGGATYVDRLADTLAHDPLDYLTGQPGPFLSTILSLVHQAGS